MKFLKKRTDYKVMYSKRDAIKLLKGDKRVRRVKFTDNKMYIYTHPIIPITTKKNYKDIFLCSIGTYKIIIVNHFNYIDCKIKREKRIGVIHHYHIQENWAGNGICWGTACSEVETIENNKDWFWLVKRCLDLLEDGNPEYGETEKWYKDMYTLMIDYALSKKNKKLAEKLRKIQTYQLSNFC